MSRWPSYERALAKGASYGEIARAEGLDYATVRMRCRRAGLRALTPYRRPEPQTAVRVARARKMLARGMDKEVVADRLGISPAALRMMLLRAERAEA
ncbi:hypothetical protein [Roseomonas chloroacetimidivorans]|uniref:hypothetical protein n=1 Tax=Roseomonas chloroacetimidivorans TaxID=1766656 RepID=UPI003C737326